MAKKILLIDDEKDMAQIVRKQIEQAGYKAFVAYNGEEGLAQAQDLHPHLILTDIAMPVMDGLKFYHEIKNRPDLQHIPVIFATAFGSHEDSARQMGAKDFLVKPFNSKILLEKVGSFFVAQKAFRILMATKMVGLMQTIIKESPDETSHLSISFHNDPTNLVADAAKQPPDLIVLDIDLGLSSLCAALVRELRLQPALKETPILLMRSRMVDLRAEGGWANASEIEECLDHGASHYIGLLNKASFMEMVQEYCQ